jgi:hypothetical protein
LVQVAVDALQQRKATQAADRLKAGELWHDTGLVFTTTMDQHNIRQGGIPVEEIARLAGY